MRIYSIQNYQVNRYINQINKSTSFNGYWDDESVLSRARDDMFGMSEIRGLYQGYRLSEHDMSAMLDKLVPPAVKEGRKLSDVNIDNLSEFNIFRIQGTENSYRGPRDCSKAPQLKSLNLKVVNASTLYYSLYRDIDTDALVKFIKTMQKDNVFVGCDFGQKETNFVLLANQYFNPFCKDTVGYSECNEDNPWIKFIKLLDKLTPEQKKDMGWTEEFEQNLLEKLNKNLKLLRVY